MLTPQSPQLVRCSYCASKTGHVCVSERGTQSISRRSSRDVTDRQTAHLSASLSGSRMRPFARIPKKAKEAKQDDTSAPVRVDVGLQDEARRRRLRQWDDAGLHRQRALWDARPALRQGARIPGQVVRRLQHRDAGGARVTRRPHHQRARCGARRACATAQLLVICEGFVALRLGPQSQRGQHGPAGSAVQCRHDVHAAGRWEDRRAHP